MNKADLRAHIKSILIHLEAGVRAQKCGLIANYLYSLEIWNESKSVLIFLPLPEEVDTYPIIDEACGRGKLVAVPRVSGKNLVFHDCVQAQNFIKSKLGIREPSPGEPLVSPEELEMPVLVITPGLAFDREKHRLGRGGGFYDRFLKTLRLNGHIRFHTIAICFSEQLFVSIPTEDFDEKVDVVVTDREIIL